MNVSSKPPHWTPSEMRLLLAFFASMLWQDGSLHPDDRAALHTMAHELGLGNDDPQTEWLAQLPPLPDEIDPQTVPPRLAGAVLALATLAAGVRPSLARYEALELLEQLLAPESPAPLVLDLLAA